MHPFLPLTDEDKEQMLKRIGVSSFEELLREIPEEARFKGQLKLPPALSEMEVEELLEDIAGRNRELILFAGGGAYDHYIPKAVFHIVSRPEFYTAYTPYQPEVSQGTLQAMYEYQSAVCELTGMDIANASMYDGGSALAEAALMALRIMSGKHRILYPASLNPFYRDVLRTYLHGQSIPLQEIAYDDSTGQMDLDDLLDKLDDDVAALIIQNPNFFGVVERTDEIQRIKEEKRFLLIVSFDPISLSLLSPPGEYGADIAVGEGQPLGLPLSFGGPYLGIFTAKRDYIRQMPGRMSGATVDVEGRRGFVMALQTREQHIRRARATSNICTNQNLCALTSLVYMSLLGASGLEEVALQSMYKAHYMAEELVKAGFEMRFSGPFFREFVVKLPVDAEGVVDKMASRGFHAGIPLGRFGFDGNLLLVALTEKRKKREIDGYVEALREVI